MTVRINVLGRVVIANNPALLLLLTVMLPYLKGTRTQALTASLSRITFHDKVCSMSGLLAQLRQEITDKVVQSEFAADTAAAVAGSSSGRASGEGAEGGKNMPPFVGKKTYFLDPFNCKPNSQYLMPLQCTYCKRRRSSSPDEKKCGPARLHSSACGSLSKHFSVSCRNIRITLIDLLSDSSVLFF
jgi:hypothetical protein